MMLGMTPHQQAAFDRLVVELTVHPAVVLQGSAGVGKTVVLGHLVSHFKPFGRVACGAPTHRAAGVLQSRMPRGVRVNTLHRVLGIRGQVDEETGELLFAPEYMRGKNPLRGVKLLVVDEASMVSTSLLDHLVQSCEESKTKLLLCGDSKQLSPVGEMRSPAFTSGFPAVELTEIVRQAEGNPIISLSMDLHAGRLISSSCLVDGRGYATTGDLDAICGKLMQRGLSMQYLAWTNRDVDSVNALVRSRLYGNPKRVELGDRLVMKGYYKDRRMVVWNTNDTLEVEGLSDSQVVSTLPDGGRVEIPTHLINGSVHVPREEGDVELKRLLRAWFSSCKSGESGWAAYFERREAFARVGYSYALTVHKAQGSTYDAVAVNLSDVMRNPNLEERRRMLYTAVTRARNLVVLYHERGD